MFSPIDGDEGLSMLQQISSDLRVPNGNHTVGDRFKQPNLFADGAGPASGAHHPAPSALAAGHRLGGGAGGRGGGESGATRAHQVSFDASTQHDKARAAVGAHTGPAFALTPGNYEIVLGIDTMEQTGSRKDKGVIQTKLAAMGVKTTVRTLALGDFVWFAQERVRPLPGQVLDRVKEL